MATASTLDPRVVEAALGIYFEGVTEEIAFATVGTEGVPTLLTLLEDPSFPRRDNVVAFLFHLGGDESTDALIEFLTAPPASLDIPEEDRALLLAPQALGKIASRGDDRALATLLEMAGSGDGLLDVASRHARNPSRLREDLVRMTLRGLGFSRAPDARALLDATVRGDRLGARGGRRVAESASTALELMQPDASGPLIEDTSAEDSSAEVSPSMSSSSLESHPRTHQTSISYANHVDVLDPMTDARLDAVLGRGTTILGRSDFAGDLACCVTFARSGSALSFGASGDGLDVIDSGAQLNAVLDANAARAKVVRTINACGGPTPNVLGCAPTPGKSFVVVRVSNLVSESILWIHEYGHNTGLSHHPSLGFIMHGSANVANVGITQMECNRYHAPSSINFVGPQLQPTDIGACGDADDDGVHDFADNCPLTPNHPQTNSDGIPPGDACIGICGNRVVDAGEECDDANLDPTDGCTNDCTICGNGIVTPPEQCDDANLDPGDGCTNACTECGDGIVTFPEECDDGNLDPDDGCNHECRLILCGDGIVTEPEQCDDGNDDPADGCTNACTICGDGIVTPPEQCDDGNDEPADGCTNACTACGDGIVTFPEECDDGNSEPGDGCTNACTECGNGVVTPPEECDDGNLIPNDGCEPTCTLSPVHDSVLLPIKPLAIALRAGAGEVRRKLRFKVRNADVSAVSACSGHPIQVAIAPGTCPPSIVAVGPDFDRKTPGVQDAALVPSGRSASVVAELRITDAFTSLNKKSRHRCVLYVTATSVGAYDPMPSNNTVAVEINVFDANDADPGVAHQSVIESAKPMRLKIARGRETAAKPYGIKVTNADIGEIPGHEIAVTGADGTCPAGTIGAASFGQATGDHPHVTIVAGGRSRSGRIGVAFDAGSILSGSALSPARCTALISAAGSAGDLDPTNDTTHLTIDVIDQNDF